MSNEESQKQKKTDLLVQALKQMDDMVFITDINSVIIYANDSLIRKLGYAQDELIGHKANIFKSDKHTTKFYKNLWETILSGKNYHGVMINKTKNGKLLYADLNITPLFDKNKNIQNFVAMSTDITNRILMEKKLKKLTIIDSLTGIYNRYKMEKELNRQIARHQRYKEPFCMLIVDIDDFKGVNESYGYDAGDRVLITLSQLISNNIRTTDIVGRWGDEEFVVILDYVERDNASAVAQKIRQIVDSNMIDGKYKITVSVGVTQYKEGETGEGLVKKMGGALHEAKKRGRNKVVVV